ncbi:hypothetical protein WM04_25860 [Burkholderia ubonensis]|uniref:HNH endonuclease n=1 Tax=Burkholderia ubonensis TaxID=101571 RepID=UPI0007537CEC|nr:HNH endonuclease [Burkholderia ubonensis]KWI25664.1 hypothetical protein WM04_25860 [Burkholderia ubonensis]OJB18525.1 hypothetical protein BGV53_10050 [Burkholderia ubonensis]
MTLTLTILVILAAVLMWRYSVVSKALSESKKESTDLGVRFEALRTAKEENDATNAHAIADLREQLATATADRDSLSKFVDIRDTVVEADRNACAVTGCSVTRVVVASHAKPWADSTDDERLDPNNGLPLVATLDKLFDAGLIGFDPVTGDMRVSSTVGAHDRMLLGVPAPLRRKPNAKQSAFLRYHLDYVFQRETEGNEPPARRCFESR